VVHQAHVLGAAEVRAYQKDEYGDTEKENGLKSEEEGKTSTFLHTLCAVQMYARVSRRAYTPFHAMPCQAVYVCMPGSHAEGSFIVT